MAAGESLCGSRHGDWHSLQSRFQWPATRRHRVLPVHGEQPPPLEFGPRLSVPREIATQSDFFNEFPAQSIVFEGTRAVGVKHLPPQGRRIASAAKEIVVSGGGFGSPQ